MACLTATLMERRSIGNKSCWSSNFLMFFICHLVLGHRKIIMIKVTGNKDLRNNVREREK